LGLSVFSAVCGVFAQAADTVYLFTSFRGNGDGCIWRSAKTVCRTEIEVFSEPKEAAG
jgi:hypothetical protein